jgi:hypothetical protein
MPQSATTQYLSRGYTPYTPPGTSSNGIGAQLGGQFRQNPTFGSYNQMPQGNASNPTAAPIGQTYQAPQMNYTPPSAIVSNGRLGAMGHFLGSSDPAQQAMGRQQLGGLLGSQYGDYFRSQLPQGYLQQLGWGD